MTHASDVVAAIEEISHHASELDAEAQTSGAVFARFYGFDGEWELETRDTVRIANVGGLGAVAIRCARESEEADLLDIDGRHRGRVVNDGSVCWRRDEG